jgi:hypothetical protein
MPVISTITSSNGPPPARGGLDLHIHRVLDRVQSVFVRDAMLVRARRPADRHPCNVLQNTLGCAVQNRRDAPVTNGVVERRNPMKYEDLYRHNISDGRTHAATLPNCAYRRRTKLAPRNAIICRDPVVANLASSGAQHRCTRGSCEGRSCHAPKSGR